MAKRAVLSVRLPAELKRDLEEIAQIEERTISQVCELVLRTGVADYKKSGLKSLVQASVRKSGKGSGRRA